MNKITKLKAKKLFEQIQVDNLKLTYTEYNNKYNVWYDNIIIESIPESDIIKSLNRLINKTKEEQITIIKGSRLLAILKHP